MADLPPWPPPDPERPFDWEQDDVEWDESHQRHDEWIGLVFALMALGLLAFGLYLLLTTH